MKKSILIVLVILLAFSVWSVLAFGKAKRDDTVKQAEVQKAEEPANLPEVVLPRVHPTRPSQQDIQKLWGTKGLTPEQVEANKQLRAPAQVLCPEDIAAKTMEPAMCRISNRVGVCCYYWPNGSAYMACWGETWFATLENPEVANFYTCNYPIYPLRVDSLSFQTYNGFDPCTLKVRAEIWSVDYSGGTAYPGTMLYSNPTTYEKVQGGGFIRHYIPFTDACVNEPFFAMWIIENTDDFQYTPGDTSDYCGYAPYQFQISWMYDQSGRYGISFWGPYGEYGLPYGFIDVNDLEGGALSRLEAYTTPAADGNGCPTPSETWWMKPPADEEYAPFGIPDFNQYQMPHTAYCGPTSAANSIWWFAARGDFAPSWGGMTPEFVPALIGEVAVASGTTEDGTECDALLPGMVNTIKAHGGWWFDGYTLYGDETAEDFFWTIQKELKACEDIVLLLGFWQEVETGIWQRFGGHFVSLAGADIFNIALAFSDPAIDGAEFLTTPGIVSGVHTPANDPLDHNFTPTSHDFYYAAWPSTSPGGYVWLPDYYANWPMFQGQNFRSEHTVYAGTYNDALPVHVEIEQATIVSPGSRFFYCDVWSSHINFRMSNFGREGDGGAYNFYNYMDGSGNHLWDGTMLLGLDGATLAANFQTNVGYSPLVPCIVEGDLDVDPLIFYADATDTLKGMKGTATFQHGTIPELEITQVVYGFGWTKDPDDPIELLILQEFDITNKGVDPIGPLVYGLFFDYDVDAELSSVANTGGGDSLYNTAWQNGDVNSIMTTLVPEVEGLVSPMAIVGEQNNYFYPAAPGPYDSMYALMNTTSWVYPLDAPPDFDYSTLMTTPQLTLAAGETKSFTWFKWQFHGDATEPGTDRTKMTLAARQQLYKLLQWKGFYRGDVNGDYKLDVSDVISIINYMFKSGVKPLPLVNQADVNCDGSVTTGDIIYIINYLFKSSGLAPVDKNRWKPEIAPRPGLFGDPIWKNLPK